MDTQSFRESFRYAWEIKNWNFKKSKPVLLSTMGDVSLSQVFIWVFWGFACCFHIWCFPWNALAMPKFLSNNIFKNKIFGIIQHFVCTYKSLYFKQSYMRQGTIYGLTAQNNKKKLSTGFAQCSFAQTTQSPCPWHNFASHTRSYIYLPAVPDCQYFKIEFNVPNMVH